MPYCNDTDSQVHIVLQCHHPDLDGIHVKAVNEVHLKADEMLSDYANNVVEFFSAHFTEPKYPEVD